MAVCVDLRADFR